MTTYLIDMVFNSKEQAEYYIECNLGESSLYEVEIVGGTFYYGENL